MSRCRGTLFLAGASLSLAASNAGCQLLLSPAALGTLGAGTTQVGEPVAGRPGGPPGPGATRKSGSSEEGGPIGGGSPDATRPSAAILSGTVTRPDAGLISNNSASLTDVGGGVFLTDVGGGMFYRLGSSGSRRIQALNQYPVSGALVVVSGPDLRPRGEVQTDAQGRFAISLPEGTAGTALVHALFREGGLPFHFSAILALPASGVASVDIDAATTLVTAKVREANIQGRLDSHGQLPRLGALVRLLRERLIPETIPYMASGSPDLVPAFDQLALDDPEIRSGAAAVDDALARSSRAWQVSKLFDFDDLTRLGVYAPDDPPMFTRAGTFEVDKAGNLYFPRFVASSSVPIEIIRVSQTGATASFAVLPAGYLNPALQAFGPDGTYYAAALEARSYEVHIFKGSGTMARIPGKLIRLPSVLSRLLGGRLAVDEAGNVACALPGIPAIWFKEPDKDGVMLAGHLFQSGYRDGTGMEALFNQPSSAVFGPDGALYVADGLNRAVRRVTREGQVTTVAGAPDATSYRNGRGFFARFGTPDSLALYGRTLFITDSSSHRVRRISPDGLTLLVAGNGEPGIADGPGPEARLNQPDFLALDGEGNLYLRDRGFDVERRRDYQVIRKLARP